MSPLKQAMHELAPAYPMFYTNIEGGTWYPITEQISLGKCHSLLFSDRSSVDVINGIREDFSMSEVRFNLIKASYEWTR